MLQVYNLQSLQVTNYKAYKFTMLQVYKYNLQLQVNDIKMQRPGDFLAMDRGP